MTDTAFKLRERNWTWGEVLPKNWVGEYTSSNVLGFDAQFQKYNDIVDWIQSNIKGSPHANARWALISDCIYVYIRRPKDWTMFTLRWGGGN